MRRFLLLAVFVSNSLLFAAGPADLLTAVRNGDHAQVRKLIESGTDVNSADKEGTTALMHSVVEADARMLKLLIDKGANVNASNTAGSTALMYAVTNLEKAKMLLDAGANVKVKNKYGNTPMNVVTTTFHSAGRRSRALLSPPVTGHRHRIEPQSRRRLLRP